MTADIALRWLPFAAAALLAAVALAAAHGRRGWTAAAVVAGILAVAVAGWQGRQIHSDAAILSARLSEVAGTAAPSPPDPNAAVRDAAEKLDEDALRIKQLEEKVAALRKSDHVRSIDPATAAEIAAYLKGFGNRRVVVSCLPDDVEAFDYANQLVSVLKAANWDASGPELTTIFGTAPTMAISFYANGAQRPDAATILADAFRKFGIPYASRIAPSDEIPDPGTVELFVAPKPSGPPGGGVGSSAR